MREGVLWGVGAATTLSLASMIGLGSGGPMVLVMSPLMLLVFVGIGRIMSSPVDRTWLPTLVALGFLAKLSGAGARYYFVRYVYGTGDALHYYDVGVQFAHLWRSGSPPALSEQNSIGTQVMEWVTGFVFAPFIPDLLGAFFLFAAISYLGQLAFYAAFRYWAKPHQFKPFAVFILFMPTFVFWPSSLGKDAVVVLGLGLATYFVARVLRSYEMRWLLALGVILVGVGMIRVHIAGLLIGSLLGTALIAKSAADRRPGTSLRRAVVVVISAVIAVAALSVFQERTGFTLSSGEEVTAFSDEFVRRTSERGTVASGQAVGGPQDIPAALLLTLFRPFLWEANELQVLGSAVETTFLLLLVVWKLPAMLRNRRAWRANPLVVFSTIYIIAYSIAFSVIRNFGIIARQRTQVLAFLLIVIVALGWGESKGRARRGGLESSPEEPSAVTPLVGIRR